MEKDILKVLMHPIRIKIIQELSFKKTATTKELQQSCGDCAQATLYRHIKALVEHEIIIVVSSHLINGITEKVYGISENLGSKIIKDPKEMTKEDYMNLFTQFILALLTDFSNYFDEEDALENAIRSIGFSTNVFLLSDEEMAEMQSELSAVVIKRLNNSPSSQRRMRKLSTILTTTNQK